MGGRWGNAFPIDEAQIISDFSGSQKLEKNMEWMQLDIIRYP